MQKKILIIEDQEDMNQLLRLNLETEGYHVDSSHHGIEGLDMALTHHFDLIVLDIMLPGIDGLQICQHVRAAQNVTPILMLTAKKTETDRVLGLEMGADDYLTKPFSIRELQARVKAQLRRANFIENRHQQSPTSAQPIPNSSQDSRQVGHPQNTNGAHQAPNNPPKPHHDHTILSFDELRLDAKKRQVKIHDKKIPLTAKEFDLLHFMAQSPGQVFNRQQLLDAVWGYQHSGYEHTVNSHINRLRNKLESSSSDPKFVLTVWGVGYQFYDR